MLQSNSLLLHFDPSKRLILTCDTLPYGVGAVLSHVMEDQLETPIAYASRTLSAAEKGYSQLDKEGLAILFGVKKFHSYLWGCLIPGPFPGNLHLDFAAPFMNSMFMVLVDAYSKWLDIVLMSSITSASTVEKLQQIFATQQHSSLTMAAHSQAMGFNLLQGEWDTKYHLCPVPPLYKRPHRERFNRSNRLLIGWRGDRYNPNWPGSYFVTG